VEEKYEDTKGAIRSCKSQKIGGMVFNATFNNISVISWRSVLLVEETTMANTDRVQQV
jgi:hypothetical protein